MNPVNHEKINQLIAEMESKSESVPANWYVGPDGMPYWAQDPLPFVMIAGGMSLQPREDGPEYRIVDFEDFPGREINVVRVEICDAKASKPTNNPSQPPESLGDDLRFYQSRYSPRASKNEATDRETEPDNATEESQEDRAYQELLSNSKSSESENQKQQKQSWLRKIFPFF